MTLFLLNTTIKVSLIVSVALIASVSLRRSSAGVRHFVLAVALACAAATPAVRLVVPAWHAAEGSWLTHSRIVLIDRPLAVLDAAAPATPQAGSQPATPGWSRATLARAFGITWLIGVVAALCALAIGLARLTWLASRARRVTSGVWVDLALELSQRFRLRHPPVILCSGDSSMLGTWGVLRAKVLVPASALEWPADRIRIVLAHELAHVRRGDWMVQVAADLLRSVHWFNPVVWFACRHLRLLSEQACDDAVLKLGVEGSDYASELIDLARASVPDRPRFLPAAAIARPSSLERRVRAMLNAHLNRNPITRPASIAAALALTVVTVVVAGFGASAQSQFGSVAGTVSDQNGRPIAGATLVLSNPAAQEKHELKTDAAGRYEFVGVTPATYELLFQVTGMASIKREGLTVVSGQAVTVNAVMQIGSIMETISVTPGEGPAPPRPRVTQVPRVEKPDPCATSPNGGCVRPPIKIKDVRPIYPVGVPGSTVVLNGRIDTNGLVTGLEVLRQADPALASAALDAVNGWEFLPTHLDGQPIETRMTVTVNFVDPK
jgi:TonB family protein